MDFSAVIIVLFKLFFLLVLGYVLFRRHILDEHANKAISALIVNATSPALVLGSLSATAGTSRGEVMKLVFFGIGLYILLPLMAWLVVRLFKVDLKKRGTVQLLLVFGNTGFMAIPILQALYGDVAVFYCNILNLPFNLMIFTYGVYLLHLSSVKEASEDAAKEPAKGFAGRGRLPFSGPALRKMLLTPGIICSVLALILYFCNLQLPRILGETFQFIGNVTPPLSMLVIGSVLAEYPLRAMFSDLKIDLILVLKLLLFPVLVLVFSRLVFTDPVMIGINTLTFGMPCASMCVMLSKEHGGDSQVASSGVVFTTILSLLTIPIIYLVLSPFFG